MTEFAWDPKAYLQLMAQEVPDYQRLQEEMLAATLKYPAQSVLDLGIGSGLTAARVLEAHPDASLVGVDASSAMLAAAEELLDPARATLYRSLLQDPLPRGPFDLVLSMLAVHHLDAAGKADLFRRVAAVMSPGGHFVLADLVVPESSDDVVTPVDGIYDVPSSLADQLGWMADAGLSAEVHWQHRDLAVVISTKTARP